MILPGIDDFTFFAKTVISSTIFLSNVYFMIHNSYFASSSQTFPLLHTWSLSVEEQYYVLCPLILIILHKLQLRQKYKIIIFASLFLASYLFSIYCIRFSPKLAYYSIFTRAFELMVGSILAIVSRQQAQIAINKSDANIKVSYILLIIGLLLILYSLFFINEQTPFPGYIAISPTLGTALIIGSGITYHNNQIIKILFSNKLVINLGLLSYSIYLWHWPILAFWHYYNPEENISFITGIFLIFFTIILSKLSYSLVEKPIINKAYSFKFSFITFWLIPTFIMISISLVVIKTNGFFARLSNKTKQEITFISDDYCFNKNTGNCIVGDLSQHPTRVLLFGDSHAAALFPFWNNIAKNNNFSIEEIAGGFCYPLLDDNNHAPSTYNMGKYPEKCSDQIKYITKNIDNFDVFILASLWSSYLPTGLKSSNKLSFTDEFNNTLKILSQHNKKVIIMGDVPNIEGNQISKYIRRSVFPVKLGENPTFTVQEPIENNIIRSIGSKYNNVYYFDTSSALLKSFINIPYYNNVIIYLDDNHLNQYGSEKFAEIYADNNEMKQLVQWIKN